MCSVKPQNDLSHKGHAVEEWADLHFFRPIGIRIARALQPTGISADQVTLWSLVIGLVAGQLFAYQDSWANVNGFVLLIVSDIFDSEDDQLARLGCRCSDTYGLFFTCSRVAWPRWARTGSGSSGQRRSG